MATAHVLDGEVHFSSGDFAITTYAPFAALAVVGLARAAGRGGSVIWNVIKRGRCMRREVGLRKRKREIERGEVHLSTRPIKQINSLKTNNPVNTTKKFG